MSQQKDDFVLCDKMLQAVYDFVVDYKEGVAD